MAGFKDLVADALDQPKVGTQDKLLKVAEILERPGADVSKAKSNGHVWLLRMLQRYLCSVEV